MILYEEFETKTGGRLDALDITQEAESLVAASGIRDGNVLAFSPHTTCCVLVAAPGPPLIASLQAAMERIAPLDGYYAHDDLAIRTENLVHDEPANAPAHLAHMFLGKASECVPVAGSKLLLGEGQRILFVELDSSRARRYCIQVVGE